MPVPDDLEPSRQLEERLAAWFEAVDLGTATTLESFCADAPELLPPLRDLLHGEGDVMSLMAELHPATTDTTPVVADDLVAGKYLIHERLGGGGAGTVHRATDVDLDREVALKLLHPQHLSSESLRARFEREARILAQLDHPAITPVYDFDGTGSVPYLAMKLLDGNRLAPGALPLPPRQVAEIGRTLARGLHAAHEAGVVHRDVKPDNIVFDQKNRPLLADFGLARVDDGRDETQEGAFAGTIIYMSPEQFQGETRGLDARTDIYSLGATLYELCEGQPPFHEGAPREDGSEVVGLAFAILNTPPQSISLSREHQDLDLILRACLQKEREDRYNTARELAEDLDRFLDGEPIRWRPQSPWERLRRRVRRHPRLSATVVAAALAFIALSFGLWYQTDRDHKARDEAARRVRSALAEGNPTRVEREFQSLVAVWPNEDVTHELRIERDRIRARERLLDFVQRRLGAHDLSEGENAIAAMRLISEGPSPFDRTLVGLAHYLLGQLREAQEIGESRNDAVGKALVRLVKNEPVVNFLSPSETPNPEDALLLAMTVALSEDVGLSFRRELIDLALQSGRYHPRALAERARLHDSEGNGDAMLAICEAIDPTFFSEQFLRYLTIAAYIHTRRPQRGVTVIEGIPESQWTLDDRGQLARIRLALDDTAGAEAALAPIDVEATRHIGLLRAACIVAQSAGRDEDAVRLADRLSTLNQRHGGSFTNDLTCIEIAVRRLAPRTNRSIRELTDLERAEARRLIRELEQITLKAELPVNRGTAFQYLFLLHMALNDRVRAYECLDQCSYILPDRIGIEAQWITLASHYAPFTELHEDYRDTFGTRASLIRRAKRRADRILAAGRPTAGSFNQIMWDQTLLIRASFAVYADDFEALERLIPMMRDWIPSTSPSYRQIPQFRRALDVLRKGKSFEKYRKPPPAEPL